jgi:hypothetical protein
MQKKTKKQSDKDTLAKVTKGDWQIRSKPYGSSVMKNGLN